MTSVTPVPHRTPFTLAARRYRAHRNHVTGSTHLGRLSLGAAALGALTWGALKAPRGKFAFWALAAPVAGLLANHVRLAAADKTIEHEYLLEQVGRLQLWAFKEYSLVILTPEAIKLLDGALAKTPPSVITPTRRYTQLQLLPTHSRTSYEFLLAEAGVFLPQVREW